MEEINYNVMGRFLMMLLMLVVGLASYIAYDKLKENNVIKDKEKNEEIVVTADTLYQDFLKKTKKAREENNGIEIDGLRISFKSNYINILEDGTIQKLNFELLNNGLFYCNFITEEESLRIKISEKILMYFVINDEDNEGYEVYMLKENGEIYYTFGLEKKTEVSVLKEDKAKNIIHIYNSNYSTESLNTYGPVFVDIEGNMYGYTLKEEA